MSATVSLENRDYTVIIAKSASLLVKSNPDAKTRWQVAQNSILALVKKCEEFDPDGITVYFAPETKYEKVTFERLEQVFAENQPAETLALAPILQQALNDYFTDKAAGQSQANGQIIIVVIDGEPSDRMAVVKTIVKASQQIESDQELGIGFVQVGTDPMTKGFFTSLDDDLHTFGAHLDIVDYKVLDTLELNFLIQFLHDILLD